MRVLIIEDDLDIATNLYEFLEGRGCVVDMARDGVSGMHLAVSGEFDAIVLDLGLPGMDGLRLCSKLRREACLDVPVLILTARDGWAERVEGLQAGADDYLGKPFHVEELLARIQALLRRAAPVPDTELRAGDWRLDEARQCLVDRAGNEQALTATEFRLLRYFMRHPDEVLSKTRLSEHVYDYDAERDSNVIEVYVRRLRGLLGNERIETRRGQGYVFRSGD